MLFLGELFSKIHGSAASAAPPLEERAIIALAADTSGKHANAEEARPGNRIGRAFAEGLIGGDGCARKISAGIIRETAEWIGGEFQLISFPDHAAPSESHRVIG